MRQTATWLVVGLCMGVSPLRAQGAGEPPIIDSIVVVTRNVFDRDEASQNFLFRLANLLHVPTRPYVVRQELQFRTGEPYDSAKIAESERPAMAVNARCQPCASSPVRGSAWTLVFATPSST